ncbi:MAG TPA: PHP domain-containing protein [Clostridiales bacterium]|jgi:hypothetical protein|nr:PHP domain-containing protein [Clostridiales bacterium]HRT82752.1 PHP domain-containing protein [Oscillospiraceae bacterium]
MEFFYDFHIHSCLSACADNDMTPKNLANMAKLAGLDIIALTDHNSCLNCPATQKAAEEAGLGFVPGMELCTQEEVHLICLFPDLERALSFSEHVGGLLPEIENKPDIFGDQIIMGENDNFLGNHKKLLNSACQIDLEDAVKKVEGLKGFCYPAHIDRPSYSLLSNLGDIDPSMGFSAFEVTAKADLNALYASHPHLKKLRLMRGSDAHTLADISDAFHTINLKNNSLKDVLDYLNKKTF